METTNVDLENKTNTTSATEDSLNSSAKSDKEETTTPKSQTENQLQHSNDVNSHSNEPTDNGDAQEEQPEINSKHIQIILEKSVKAIHDIKTIISEFEKSVLKITKLVGVNCKNNIQEIEMKNFLKNFDNLRKIQEHGSHNELKQRINSQKPARYESSRKNEDMPNTRKSKPVKNLDKRQITYRSESPTESDEEEQSNESMYDPSEQNTKYRGDTSRTRSCPRRTVKSGRKSRGRPRKQQNNDDSSNSPVEIREKKVRGSPRKYVPEDEISSASNTEVVPKKSRGRPRKTVNNNEESSESEPPAKKSRGRPKKSRGRPKKSNIEDQSSTSIKDTKDNHSNNQQESESEESKDKESTNSNEQEVKVLSDKSKENVEKRQKGRPRKIVNNEKLPQAKSNKDLNNSNLETSIARSRGRPKKIKNIVENETPVEST